MSLEGSLIPSAAYIRLQAIRAYSNWPNFSTEIYFNNPLAVGKDVLDNLHGNTHLPLVIGIETRMGEKEVEGSSK
jgi:glutaredoxin-related protein